MKERVNFIRHQGVEVLLIDWTDASAEEILAAIEQAKTVIASRPAKSVRTLTLVGGARIERRVTESLKEYVAHNKPYVLAGAVVGLNDLKTVIFNFINRVTGRSLRAVDSVEDGKSWLVSVREPV